MLTDRTSQCVFCDSVRLLRFTARAFDTADQRPINIVECQECQAAWQWPIAHSEEQSVKIFEAEYAKMSGYFDESETAARCELELEFIATFTKPGHLLDIGAGSGSFVKAAARRGWAATGVEPAAVCFDDGSAKMVAGTVDALPPFQTFDVVTLFDVVEHVPDYVSLLRKAHNRLVPGGWIVVETGNYQSLNRLRGGREWWCFQADHRWYLSPGILRGDLEALGFDQICLHAKVLRPHWNAAENEPLSLLELTKRIVRRPWRTHRSISVYRQEQTARKQWPNHYRLGIITLAGMKRA